MLGNKILIVDDEKNITDSLGLHLQLEGYNVFTTNNPLNAPDIIVENNIHVVISDVEMPELNGIDLLRKIKESNGTVRVIMMTNNITFSNLISCLSYGAGDLLLKPFENLEEVSRAVIMEFKKLEKWNNILKKNVNSNEGII